MSDPVTNAEVEDVLSSIRRLVSEEKRPLQAPKAAQQNDRLVLTPALRVGDPEPGTDPSEDYVFDPTDDEFEMSEEATAPRDAPDHDYDDPYDHADDRFEETAGSADAEADTMDGPEHDYEADPYHFDDDEDDDGERDGILTQDARDEPEADWQDEQDDVTEAISDEATHADIAAADTKAAVLSAKIEALSAVIGGAEDQFEPDEPGTDAYSGTDAPAMEWEDDQPDETDPTPEPTFVHASADRPDRENRADTSEADTVFAALADTDDGDDDYDTDDLLNLADDDQLLDEEALRDLVSEIVRAELQGALGERITRNVRKLVRREIHRALTAQDLE